MNNMMETVKQNPDMSFRELLKKTCKEKGIELEGEHSEHSDSCPESEDEGRMRGRRNRMGRMDRMDHMHGRGNMMHNHD